MDFVSHNQAAWDKYVEKKDRWTLPVSEDEIRQAENGNWKVVLTPVQAVPQSWFPELKGAKVLGLAAGGGQQGPILAALGAKVTIFDNSEKQLLSDQNISDQFNLNIQTVQGDMRNLSVFESNSFDLIFNPCSVLFVDDVKQVWKECYRILKPQGILMVGMMNPLAFQIDESSLKLKYQQPYSDLHSLPQERVEAMKQNLEPFVFAHSWSEQIGGQLAAGFHLTHLFEDDWGGDEPLDAYFPSYIATRAIKPL